MISLGSFAVNRDKPDISTIKTVLEIVKHTKWSLGIFPQGRTVPNAKTFEDIKEGFIGIAKMAKMDIVPIAICNFKGYNIIPFKGNLVMKVGKPIPYTLPEDEILSQWKSFMEKELA